MAKKSHTTDEKLVIALYEATTSSTSENPEEKLMFNRYDIGKNAGIQPKGVDAICKLLVQANFVKKGDDDQIYLTDHGTRLALRLLDEA